MNAVWSSTKVGPNRAPSLSNVTSPAVLFAFAFAAAFAVVPVSSSNPRFVRLVRLVSPSSSIPSGGRPAARTASKNSRARVALCRSSRTLAEA